MKQMVARSAGVAVALAAAAFVILLMVLPMATGGAALTVLSGSMTPTIPVGSIVLVQPVDPDAVRADDVITFTDSSSLVTHRVMDIGTDDEGRYFVTQGDANQGPDKTPLRDEAIRGRVWFHVPFIGSVRDAVATPEGMLVIAGVGGLVALAGPAASWWRRRQRRTPVVTATTGPLSVPDTFQLLVLELDPQGPHYADSLTDALRVGCRLAKAQDRVILTLVADPVTTNAVADRFREVPDVRAVTSSVVDTSRTPTRSHSGAASATRESALPSRSGEGS